MSATGAREVEPLNRGAGLSVKISGIVFWGMVIIGLFGAVAMLQGKQRELLTHDNSVANRLAHRLRMTLNQEPWPTLASGHGALWSNFQKWQARFGIRAVRIHSSLGQIRWGQAPANALTLSRHIRLANTKLAANGQWAHIHIAFPSLSAAVTQSRNRLMLALGLITMAFGLALQTFLNRILSRPFKSLVTAAERFGQGDTHARMDETLADEFGFLAAFINRALDSSMAQQADLQEALARAALSESALSLEKERAELTLYAITDAVITIDINGCVQYINPAAERVTGWMRENALGTALDIVVALRDESTGEPLTNPGYRCLLSADTQTLLKNAVLTQPYGDTFAIELSAAAMRDHNGDVIGAVVVFQDVSHARQLARQLSHQANHDALTGLFNRPQFEKRVENLLARSRTENVVHALLYLDMDQFKIVNDTCGHVAGDALLRQISGLLRSDLRRDDILARLGGDEFGIALVECDLDQAARIAESLRQRVYHYRFSWQGNVFAVGVSIGIVAITKDVQGVGELLSAADLSCYAAKDFGRNRIHVYHPSDEALAQRQGDMQWTNVIVDALKHDRFALYKQPMRAIVPSGVTRECYEILLRMEGRNGEIIAPGQFVPAAERYNLMPQIDRWVIRAAFCALAATPSTSETTSQMMSINLSGASLGDEGMLEYIRATANDCGVSFHDICFEITETVAISNWPLARNLIQELTVFGCQFAFDDFGSGVSSFSYLKSLPVGFLKIDGHFVQNITTDPIDRSIVEAITHIAHAFGMQTIAEWVEDEATLHVLAEIGVDFAQGNHVGPPERIESGVCRLGR
ncbi:MAG: EAL domain-containing protein [Acidiferrobacter sp.]